MAQPRALTTVLAGLLLAVLGYLSMRGWDPLPPLAVLVDPFGGVWAGATAEEYGPDRRNLPGLSAPVEVLVDDRAVPHVFAATEEDAYRVMGWLVARDRLFQLELQTRAAEGTLTELFGQDALQDDRQARLLGLGWGAERAFASLDSTSEAWRALAAYADGINAWIAQLPERKLPFEYRLIDRRPRRWEAIHTGYLIAQMGRTLASGDPADVRLVAASLVGEAAADVLVPRDAPIQEPIQPRPGSPRFLLPTVPPPGAPDSTALALLEEGSAEVMVSYPWTGDRVLGSNNWAVAPARTRDGHALLAGDPHLAMTLPAIWYEVHLMVPGRLDVAGVALVGSPGVVIGFNRDLAWTFTNTQGDFLDRYIETVDEVNAPTRYLLDGEWRPLEVRVEEYRDPAGHVVAVDSVRYTHRGPMTRRGERWLSLRWTMHEGAITADVLLRAARATSSSEWLEVMERYIAPVQNGLVADRSGTIAIRSSGRYPVRPGDGRGDVVRDGSTRAVDWTGYLPIEEWPGSVNPPQGFLVSANQQPVDPLDQPAYLGADWPAPWRALRINTLLRADTAVTVDAMRRYQTDPGSARADVMVPLLLGAADRVLAVETDPLLADAARLLRGWPRTYEPADRQAVLFELAMDELLVRTFDELRRPGARRPALAPDPGVLLALNQDPANPWWDNHDTPQIETRDTILAASLRAAYETAVERHGDPGGPGWEWGTSWTASVRHLLGLRGFSALHLPVPSGPSTISPLPRPGSQHGASWRMVVELGPEVRAWGTYPGGQSGNPASPWYEDRVPQWQAGELSPILFPRTPGEVPADRVVSRLTFVPAAEDQ